MRLLGIIGGIAPGSTADYYRLLVERYRDRRPDGSYPPLVITSIDLTRMLALVGAARLDELVEYLGVETDRLARAGVEVGLLASNTPHVVFDPLSRRSPIPLLSIVEAAAETAGGMGLRSVGLLGTRYTMEGRFYPEVFDRRGITVRPPARDDLEWVHEKYMGELVAGAFRPATRTGLLRVIDRLARDGVEGVLLAGTELPLLLRDAGEAAVPLLDTTRIHVDRAVAEILAGGEAPLADFPRLE